MLFRSKEKITLSEKLNAALEDLLQAYGYAEDTQSDCWDFAVGIRQLYQLGLNNNDLRWLVCKDYVKHAKEVTLPEDNGRAFRSTGNLTFTEQTCFVLVQSNISTIRTWLDNEADFSCSTTIPNASSIQASSSAIKPQWHSDLRELRVGALVVKRFKWQAVNQETILEAFDEEDWPAAIDDPLPPKADQDSKRRLHDTIKALNRNQIHPLLRFHGDGTGEGIRWERIG